jgi:hypothetical protein
VFCAEIGEVKKKYVTHERKKEFWNFVLLHRIYCSGCTPDIMSYFEFGEIRRNKWHSVFT